MNQKFFFMALMLFSLVVTTSCNSGDEKDKESSTTETTTGESSSSESSNPKGIGPHQNVQLTHPLDEKMVTDGKNVYDVKCQSCHKLTDEKLVGPGWKGVTDRRTPEWIMNFVTNVEEMLAKDTAAQNMLEVCLVKMPNQGLTEADARSVLEYMRKNDGKQ
jgi:cytochrome c2